MTQPIGYANFGWSFLRSAECLLHGMQSGDFDIRFNAPVVALVGQGMELILKSFLWHTTGRPASFTHDLCQLHEQAVAHGLPASLSTKQLNALRHLNSYVGVQPYTARYLETGAGPDIPFSEWFALARTMMDAVEPILAPDRVANAGLRSLREPPPQLPSDNRPLNDEQAAEVLAALFRTELEQ